MPTIASAHQPNYPPWSGYFHKMAVADVWVVMDDVQYERRGFTNRNRVRTKDGWTWMTVPVRSPGDPGDLTVREVEIANEHRWRSKHWGTLRHWYTNADGFDVYADPFEATYDRAWDRLADLNTHLLDIVRDALDIHTPVERLSKLDVTGQGTEMVLGLCRAVDADVYYSGPAGRDYLDEDRFTDAGIDVVYQEFTHPTYDQAFDGFEPDMSVVDLLFNLGDGTRAAIEAVNASRDDVAEAGHRTAV